ncbi:MAG: S9 family peptidase [Bacteroidetes bacterium]|nr:S9 family peptidase [Bacteroidota bacterium]
MKPWSFLALGLVLGATTICSGQKALTNADIWYSPTFSSERVDGLVSMKDGVHYTTLEEEGDVPVVNQYAYKTGGKVGTVVNGRDLVPAGGGTPLAMEGYSFNGDERKLMIETATEPIYRYSYFAYNYVYDRATKSVKPLTDPAKSKQRLATFSPDGSHAAFMRDNDLFTVDLATMQEKAITTDGEWNKVLNGAPDWVYEEEFEFTQAYQWSPDGKRILFLRSDESGVREFDFTTYGHQLYPGTYKFKYPKAGEANSLVSLWVYDLTAGTTTAVPLGTDDTDIYLPRFGFTDAGTLWFMRMDRLQQEKTILTVALPPPGAMAKLTARPIYTERSKTYVDVTDDLHFLADGSFVLTTEQDGWNRIRWCSADGKDQRPVTTGDFDVTGIKGVDEAGRRVLFTASKASALQQEVWAVGLDGKKWQQLSPPGGYNDAEFSTGFKYYINTRSTANTPDVITLHDGRGKLVKTLKDNARLQGVLDRSGLRPKEFIRIPVGDGLELNASIIKPAGFDGTKQFPVLMTQYSGPNSNEVLDQWGGRDHLWHELLVQQGYIVVCVDPRGTGRRGRDFRHITYGQLGKYETMDQVAAAKWLGQQPGVDPGRIGIQGWSYGGFMSSLCITKGADVFKAAIAVAPVTNWRYYDSIYTERYMGLPKTNPAGYDDNSPINHVEKLKGNYLLVHGLADDNVHFQNSAEMVSALVKANKQFDFMAYPDKNHGIYGGTTRMQLFQKMTDFVLQKL